MYLAVARALELLEDHVIHARSSIDEGGRDDRQAAALFDVARRAEKALRALQGVGINTARKNLTRWRNHSVMRAREPRDRVEQNHHVAFMLDEALGLLN